MAALTGLLLRLKDKNTCVPDKLKLAKFAWVTDAVQIPNKHQQILDFVCGLLVNKKKHNISNEGVVLVWATLDKFLYLAGTGSVVKPSVLQAVVDDLRMFTSKEKAQKQLNKENTYLLHVLKSTQKLLLLQSVTTFQFENLCVLLSVVCQLLGKPSLGSKVDMELQALLQSLLNVLITNQKSHLNQLQVLNFVVDKLLNVAIKTLGKLPCPKLQEFLLGCLLHRDHQDYYAAYLRHTFGEPSQGHIKQSPKFIGNVFTGLSSVITETETSALTTFIMEFINIFVSQNRSEPRLCYLMLKQLVKMVVPSDDVSARSGTGDGWELDVIARCLETCQDCDLFSASSEANDILKWFFQLTKVLLEKERTPAWFAYLRAVLNLNHLVVEKFWDKILDLGFANSKQIPEDCYTDQDLFLADLVSIYMKLRRAPDLLAACLSSVETSASGSDVFSHLPHFYDRLSHMFSESPLGSLLDMWDNLQAVSVRMVELLSGQAEDLSRAYTCLHWALSFYTSLLGNSRLFNHWGFGVLGQRVVALMTKLEEKVLLVLNRKKGIAIHCPTWKELLSVWAVVKMLSFPKWREAAEIESDGKMEESVEKLSQKLDSISRLRLVVQRQNMTSMSNPESTETQEKRQRTVESIVKDFLEFPQLSRQNVFKVWDGQTDNPTALELPVHQFQQFSQVFPLIGRCLPEELMDKLVDVVVGVLSVATVEDMRSTHLKGTTLFTEVEHFLSHPATKEVKIFQERLSVAIWKIVLSGLGPSMLSPVKKKKRLDLGEDCPSLEKVKTLLTHNFEVEKCTLDLSQIKGSMHVLPHFAVMIKVLQKLDLEYLPDVSLRCQIGACVLISSLARSGNNEEFKNLVVELLIQCLSITNLSRLFGCVKPTEFLDLVIRAGSQGSALDYQLLKVAVGSVMNDYEAVLQMSHYVKKLTADLHNSCENSGVIKMKMVALIIKHCQRYVSKSFHIQRIRNIAPEIFFCLAKFVIKHGLEWFEKAKLQQVLNKKNDPIFEAASKTKNRKRKMTEQGVSPYGLKQQQQQQQTKSLTSSEDLHTTAWCSLLECLTEILDLWSQDIVDNKFNEHLASMVATVLKQALTDLESGLVSNKTKVSELAFIRACCHCQRRCNQIPTEEPTVLTSLSSPPHHEQSTTQPPDGSLCIFSGKKLQEIWTSFLSLCTSELSRQLRLSMCSQTSPDRKSLSLSTSELSRQLRLSTCSQTGPDRKSLSQNKETQSVHTVLSSVTVKIKCNSSQVDKVFSDKIESVTNVPTRICDKEPVVVGSGQPTGESMEHGVSWLDQLEAWPDCVTAHVDVLAAVMECSGVGTFQCLLGKMTESLVLPYEAEPSSVYVLMALWRRLIRSQLLSDDHVQVMFSGMYQFLSVISSLVQFHENLMLSSSLSGSSPSEPVLTMHGASRAVVRALSDFGDLGKMLVTPRMTLLCLNAAVTFTLICPSDLDALYTLINTLLVYHTNIVLRAVPTIVHIANKLITSCIEQGNEEKLARSPELLKHLLKCAHSITRLLTLVSSPAYKVDLSKVAYSVLATYLIGVQRGSLHTSVKRELVKGLYKVMSMCDKFRLAALNASLPAGVKDTFKVLHQDYEKYHRYSGFV